MTNNVYIKDIGTLSGKLLLFGGVYSNLQALEKLMVIAENQNMVPDNIICTGDIVGYCAQPEECVQLVKGWGIHTIAGNVEIELRENNNSCGCNFAEGSRCDNFSRNWYPYAQSRLSDNSLRWMGDLPQHIRFTYSNYKGYVLHGSADHAAEYIFKSTPWSIKKENFLKTDSNLILAGHCGLPFHDQHENMLWLNPGVIGMPANDGTPRVWYMMLEVAGHSLVYRHCGFEYDYTVTVQLMKENKLPEEYAKTLAIGYWDNREILPPEETSRQGIKIVP